MIAAEKNFWRQLIEVGFLSGAVYSSSTKGPCGNCSAMLTCQHEAHATGHVFDVPTDLSWLKNLDDKFSVLQRIVENRLRHGDGVEE